MSESAPVVVVDRLGRAYGSKIVLEDVRLRLSPGQRLGLAGSNGSGKTTLLRCIAGSLTPTSGTIAVDGHPAGSIPARAATGMTVAHEKAFYLRLSGRANLRFYASLRLDRSAVDGAVDSIIRELELEFAGVRVDRYSSGMLQQLALARALLGSPKLLLLDEPTRSLDEAATGRLWDALSRRPTTAAVIASHRPEDLARCDQRLKLS